MSFLGEGTTLKDQGNFIQRFYTGIDQSATVKSLDYDPIKDVEEPGFFDAMGYALKELTGTFALATAGDKKTQAKLKLQKNLPQHLEYNFKNVNGEDQTALVNRISKVVENMRNEEYQKIYSNISSDEELAAKVRQERQDRKEAQEKENDRSSRDTSIMTGAGGTYRLSKPFSQIRDEHINRKF